MTSSVTAPGDTNLSDATALLTCLKVDFQQFLRPNSPDQSVWRAYTTAAEAAHGW